MNRELKIAMLNQFLNGIQSIQNVNNDYITIEDTEYLPKKVEKTYRQIGDVLKIAGKGNKKECNSQGKCGKMQYFES